MWSFNRRKKEETVILDGYQPTDKLDTDNPPKETDPLPDNLLDDERYPTTEYLEWIEKYDILKNGVDGLLNVLSDTWMFGDWGFKRKRSRNGKFTVELHTGGWSGNEEIIQALKTNRYFWFFWRMSRVGGHYYFSFNIKK